jgi:iron complex transport system substrate-binding protein
MILLLFYSCQHGPSNESFEANSFTRIQPEFATGFSIEEYGDYKKLIINTPFQGAGEGVSYVLLPEGSELSDMFPDEKVINTPIESIVCTSTTHIPLLDYLEVESALIGFPTLDYISSSSIRKRIDEGKVAELGAQVNLNLEVLVSIQPDLVMGYSLNGDLTQLGKIENSGIPVVLNSEYLESHPLGRAEWIKVMGLLFNKMSLADSVFNEIKREYQGVTQKVSGTLERPEVLSGVVYGDTWFLPGGENYASKIIADAGGNYLWAADTSSGFLQLSFESVYSMAADADIWIGVASYNSLEQLINGDSRYSEFLPYKERQVYSYNKRMGEKGGNEYLELGYLRPDIILKDLVTIFHPGLLEGRDLYFYEQLK